MPPVGGEITPVPRWGAHSPVTWACLLWPLPSRHADPYEPVVTSALAISVPPNSCLFVVSPEGAPLLTAPAPKSAPSLRVPELSLRDDGGGTEELVM